MTDTALTDQAPELPGANEIAIAVVAAAKALGEDPADVFAEVGLRRMRYCAVEALRIIYPAADYTWLGDRLGLAYCALRVSQVKRANWWGEGGGAAVDRAIEALEAA